MKFIFSFLLLFLIVPCHGQIKLINLSLTDSSLSILYPGLNNNLKLKGIKDLSNIQVSIDNGGYLINTERDVFPVIVPKTGTYIIKIVRNGKQILSQKFVADSLPPMVARIGHITDSIATVNEILLNPFLTLERPKSFYKHNYRIQSYEIVSHRYYEEVSILQCEGTLFSEELISIIKSLKKGNYIVFQSIEIDCPECRTKKVAPFIIWIK